MSEAVAAKRVGRLMAKVLQRPVEPGTQWTLERIKCGFCGKEEHGYAKQDAKGRWKPACWSCVKPTKTLPPVVRRNRKGYLGTIKRESDEVIENDNVSVDTVHEAGVGLVAVESPRVVGTKLARERKRHADESTRTCVAK